MTLIRNTNGNNKSTSLNGGGGPLNTSTIQGEENLIENGEIEELHYLMVRVERMKK